MNSELRIQNNSEFSTASLAEMKSSPLLALELEAPNPSHGAALVQENGKFQDSSSFPKEIIVPEVLGFINLSKQELSLLQVSPGTVTETSDDPRGSLPTLEINPTISLCDNAPTSNEKIRTKNQY